MSERLSAEQWTRFWKQGTLTTFVGRFAENYDGVVGAFWNAQFADLAAGSRVLDMATGNGAVAVLAMQYSDHKTLDLEVVGVDAADIDPLAMVTESDTFDILARVDFHGNTPLERTGLPDASFDLVTSQFGFEYADLDAGCAEVARLLGGHPARFAAMLHHQQSAVLSQARDGLLQVDLCEQSGLPETVRSLLRRLDQLKRRGKAPDKDQRAEVLRHSVNERVGKLEHAAARMVESGQIGSYITGIMRVFDQATAGRLPLDGKYRLIDEAVTETRSYHARILDLTSSALDDDALAQLSARFESLGLTVVVEPFEFEGVHFAQTLVARR